MGAPLIIAVVSCSLNPTSRSHQLALAAEASVRAAGASAEFVDLREWDLPICDGGDSFEHPSVEPLSNLIENSSAVLVAAPVYNYDLNAAAKNFLEMTGQVWSEKPVGFLCSAGGERSYTAPTGFANSLMFDFRCLIIPRFVYCTKTDIDVNGNLGPAILERVNDLTHTAVTLTKALAWAKEQGEK